MINKIENKVNTNELKFSGIYRSIDHLGRVVIPIELCKAFDIDRESKDLIDVYINDEYVVFKPFKGDTSVMGLTRRIDPLGRVVIPKEIRKLLDLKETDKVSISIKDNKIYLKKFTTTCVFCNSEDVVIKLKDKCICNKCYGIIKGASFNEQ